MYFQALEDDFFTKNEGLVENFVKTTYIFKKLFNFLEN